MPCLDADVKCFCGLLLALAGALAFAALALGVAATHHERDHAVRVYDNSVAAWEASNRAAFEDAAFVFRVQAVERDAESTHHTGDADGRDVATAAALSRNGSSEPTLLRDHGADLHGYRPLRYEWRGPLLPAGAGWAEPVLRVSLEARAPTRRTVCTQPLGGADGIPLAYRVETPAVSPRQQCVSIQGGSYIAAHGTCVTYHALHELCIKVSLVDGCWRADGGGGGYGCEPGAQGDWSVGVYRHVVGRRAPGGTSFHRDPPLLTPSPVLRVRHASDPRVAALNLTGGTLAFATPDTVKALGAFELLVCAAALATPALIFFLRHLGLLCECCDEEYNGL